MPLDSGLDLLDVLLNWDVFRWLLPIALVIVGIVLLVTKATGPAPAIACILGGTVWLAWNLFHRDNSL